ncbi:MAG: histidine kinase [Proteobacteria bacterium]|nr:histidine kinase [Pseudomonadota bacterium]
MHPILARRERLLAYLLAWIPLAAIQAYLMALPGSLSLGEAAALAAPLSLVYAFLCLSSFYACRSAPLTRARTASVLGVHLVGAVIAAALLTLAGSTLASLYGTFPAFSTLPERFGKAVLPLFVLGLLLYLLAVTFHYILLSLESSQAAERRAMEARVLAREAELEALKAQLNPHFLFNALNSVSALTTTAPARARDMCVLLSDFLRRSLSSGGRPLIPLSEELALARQFLAVEKVRYGRRLEVEEEVDEALLSTAVPPLLLQPLVENAFKHGISHTMGQGIARIKAFRTDGWAFVEVEDNAGIFHEKETDDGHGIKIVDRRLKGLFGSASGISIACVPNEVTRVTVKIPLEAPAACCAP